MNTNTFGEYLKQCREEMNLSISDLHRLTGVSQPYISQIEAGKIPSRKTIIKLANGMGTTKFQIAVLETRMLDLAGYKIFTDQGEEEYEKPWEETHITENYESDIQRLELKIETLENTIILDKIIDDKAKVLLDGEELTVDEKTILKFNLLSIRAIREKNKN